MNYIKKLEKENAENNKELEGLKSGIRELMGYLHSDKFNNDPTVQAADIVRRLLEIESAAFDARRE